MLGSLSIEGFRSFPTLTLGPLARVNLFVGMNNTGKSSILEAVEILVRRGDAWALWSVPMRRGEVIAGADNDAPNYLSADPRHLFRGHELRKGASFRIGPRAGSSESVTCTVTDLRHIDPATVSTPFRFGDVGTVGIGIESRFADRTQLVALSSEGGLGQPYRSDEGPHIQFLGNDHSMAAGGGGNLWKKVVLTPAEERVTAALRIIEPAIERIAAAPRSGFGADFFLKLMGTDARVPLASTGDGMRRMLSIALSMVTSAGGYVLVDDIDTGLHHSVMTKMWQMVVETARDLDIQVFSTTHSLDCITALARLFERCPELAGSVAVHRLERGRDTATLFTSEDVVVAARHEMDLR